VGRTSLNGVHCAAAPMPRDQQEKKEKRGAD
jgi:hypothetical protein